MDVIYRLLVPAAATGFVLALLWNVAAWARLPAAAMEAGGSWLFVGIFLVWFPTVFRLRNIQATLNSWNGAWLALEGAPTWMRFGALGLFVYAFANFFVGFVGPAEPSAGSSMDFPRIASGHAMFFYGIAAVLNHAQDRRVELGLWRCPAGHDVGPAANFCAVCGARVSRPRARHE